MVNALSFVSQLETATPHSEVHGIHVNVTRVRLVFSWLKIRVFVDVNRHLDVHLLLTTLSDGLRQAEEAWMRTGDNFWHHA